MSDTVQSTTIIEKIEDLGHEALDAIEHGAVWLVGTIATTASNLNKLEANHPLVIAAIAAGEKSAVAHGIPVQEIMDAGQAILTAAKQFAAGLAQPALTPAAKPASTPETSS